jgi:3-oxoacyl-[acyl-carrier-protein] synthase II
MKRVAITGLGAVTPLGNTIDSTWNNLVLGRSGISDITKFNASGFPCRIAGELHDFRPEEYLAKKDILRLDPFIHYAAAAAFMAIEDAGLIQQGSGVRSESTRTEGPGLGTRGTGRWAMGRESELLKHAAVVIGSSRGGITTMEKAVEKMQLNGRPVSAYMMSASTINMASSYISMRLGTNGPVLGISTACASGTNAVGEAFRMIRNGDIDIAVAGGAEAPICRLAVGGYGIAGALSKRNGEPRKASRPFDAARDGFVLAEGAAVLVLEEMGHALARGARMYAELAGYGTSSDACHQTRPDSEGEAMAIDRAIRDAHVLERDIDYINAHATSTLLGDAAESEAIRKTFGEKVDLIPVSSGKSMLGHMIGAAGAVEAATTALSVYEGTIPPTINLEIPDPDCNLYFAASAIKKEIHVAISESFGFGGVNAVLVFKKFPG